MLTLILPPALRGSISEPRFPVFPRVFAQNDSYSGVRALESPWKSCDARARHREPPKSCSGGFGCFKNHNPSGDPQLSWNFSSPFAGIAFPTSISVNNCVCHFSPLKSDQDYILKDGDLVKM